MNKTVAIFALIVFYFISYNENAFAQQKEKDTLYRFGDFLIHARDTMKIDFIIKAVRPVKSMQNSRDTLYDSDKYLILGNKDKLAYYNPAGVLRKYALHYKFSDYRVAVFHGKLAPPNFKTDPTASLFKTQIIDQCRRAGINFAGHFTLVHWGCGSSCEAIAIVDRLTGKIFYSNLFRLSDSSFFQVKCLPDSQLLIINNWLLEDVKGYLICSNSWKLAVAKWDKSKFKFLMRSPGY